MSLLLPPPPPASPLPLPPPSHALFDICEKRHADCSAGGKECKSFIMCFHWCPAALKVLFFKTSGKKRNIQVRTVLKQSGGRPVLFPPCANLCLLSTRRSADQHVRQVLPSQAAKGRHHRRQKGERCIINRKELQSVNLFGASFPLRLPELLNSDESL